MIRRALLSVSDKTDLLPFARALSDEGVEILSTGGTAQALSGAGIRVVSVEQYTGSPEVMAGRVKTLHPRVHGGILMRGAIDEADLERIGGAPIDLVVVNLYPFEQTLAKEGASHAEIIENIDIGGPAMVRSAAKNFARVAVVCDPSDYDGVIAELRAGGEVTLATRRRLAAKAFAHTAAYDGLVAAYLSLRVEDHAAAVVAKEGEAARDLRYPPYMTLAFERAYMLRYGENPHQTGAFYRERRAPAGSLAKAEPLDAGGKELSFNNLVDADAALEAVREHEAPAAVIVKHTNPCGVAIASDLVTAYRTAREADPLSAFGGIVALNREVDRPTAEALVETFIECVVAPSYEAGALELLRKKKNLRVLATGPRETRPIELVRKGVSGGLCVQDRDATAPGEVLGGKVVTRRAPTTDELASLDFAWRVSKHVKSNAIVLATGGGGVGGSPACPGGPPLARTVGVGAGQMSRVESVRIACGKAGEAAKGSVLASDAFFPFPDGVELAIQHGVTAIAQPGGSVKDPDVIAAADAAGVAMVFTGVRHFRH